MFAILDSVRLPQFFFFFGNAPQFCEQFGDFVITGVFKSSVSPFSFPQTFRYVTPICQNGGEMAGPLARNLGDRPRRPLGHDSGLCGAMDSCSHW